MASHISNEDCTLYHEIKLDLHADVADWNPNPGYEGLLAAGTYQLDETNQVRHGKLYIYDVNEPIDCNQKDSLNSSAVIDLPSQGIFDLQWVPGELGGSQTVVAMALADGSVRLLDPVSGHEEVEICTCDSMALTIDTIRDQDGSLLCTSSFSDGGVRVFQYSNNGVHPLNDWKAHSLEAWVSVWSRVEDKKGRIVYSGGDDALFQAWDVRIPESPGRLFLDKKTHQAGVCCISEMESDPNIILTGSYDECIRIWDWRNSSRPICTLEHRTGGGVWRLKPHPKDPRLLLTACMYNGFLVYRIASQGEDAWTMKECEHYPHQQTLAYGASWSHRQPGQDHSRSLVATCSFYDNLLHIWSPSTSCFSA